MWTNPGEIAGNNTDDDGNGFVDDIYGYNFVANNGNPMDDFGHGTHVAGTIGAVTDNGIGVAGIAWNVKIMAVKFLDANGGGSLEDAIRAINYASMNGASISNNSWGGGGFDSALRDAIAAAATRDHLFIAAAGNDSNNNDAWPAYPATYDLDNVISVAATDNNDQLAWFSNYGATTVDLGAPGVNILSTVTLSGQLGNPSGYATLSGTSMATPHVSGVAALIRGFHPEWTFQQVKDQILNFVDPVPALASTTLTGGRLNAAAALTGVPPPDLSGPYVTSTNPRGATTGPVDFVRVSFNESVEPTSFTTDDIAFFDGPWGPLSITEVVPVDGTNNRQFDLIFADSQSELGDYEIVLGPDLTDMLGNAMNQDRDGDNGEGGEDQYRVQFSITDVMIFEATDVPVYLDWFWSAWSTITIDQDIMIGDLDVTLDITHPWSGDLVIYLFAPDGWNYITLTLFNGYGPNFTDTTFDDEASIGIEYGDSPFTGSFRPLEPMAWFENTSAYGTWTLWIDNWGFETGWLNSWSMTITPGDGGGGSPPPPPPPPPPGNNPPVAYDDYATIDEDTSTVIDVRANDWDPDGDWLNVVSVDWSSGGYAYVNPDQTVTFTADPNFNGSAMFAYTITDGQAYASAYAWITVNPINDAPTAVNDVANTYADVPLTLYEWNLTGNDSDVDYDYLYFVGADNAVNGQVTFDGYAIQFTPAAGFTGWASFEYTITDGQETSTGRVDVNVRSIFYFSTDLGGTVYNDDGSTFNFTGSDILSLTINADGSYFYDMFFDGSDVGLTQSSENIDAFAFLPDGTLLISTRAAFSVPSSYGTTVFGYGEDLIMFMPWQYGHDTYGSWTMAFDGSDVGLSGLAENVDAVGVLPDGRLLISTADVTTVPGLAFTVSDEDLLLFTPTWLGDTTAGTWSMYFDGSDVGLGTYDSEDIDAVFVKSNAATWPTLYFSTVGSFGVPNVSGANEDIFGFRPATVGQNTTGTFDRALTLNGSRYGLANFNLDGIWVGALPTQYGAGSVKSLASKVGSTVGAVTVSSTSPKGPFSVGVPAQQNNAQKKPAAAGAKAAAVKVTALDLWGWLEFELDKKRKGR
jgi:subtilisin-like proprotein convertase family protein